MAGRPYLRNLLLRRHDWMEAQVLKGAADNGYPYITPGINRLFGHMGPKPVGLTELARRMGISRQGVHKLATEAARRGLIEFVPSPEDGRVVMLRFTKAGWAMSDSAARDFRAIEDALAQRIGADKLQALMETLAMPWDESEG